jgi:hypothetical protein
MNTRSSIQNIFVLVFMLILTAPLFFLALFNSADAATLTNLPWLKVEGGDFSGLINGFFNVAVVIGAILAVIMIAIGGLRYMTTDAISQKKDSVGQMRQAALGLLMLLATYIFFEQINPDIRSLRIQLDPVETADNTLNVTIPMPVINPASNPPPVTVPYMELRINDKGSPLDGQRVIQDSDQTGVDLSIARRIILPDGTKMVIGKALVEPVKGGIVDANQQLSPQEEIMLGAAADTALSQTEEEPTQTGNEVVPEGAQITVDDTWAGVDTTSDSGPSLTQEELKTVANIPSLTDAHATTEPQTDTSTSPQETSIIEKTSQPPQITVEETFGAVETNPGQTQSTRIATAGLQGQSVLAPPTGTGDINTVTNQEVALQKQLIQEEQAQIAKLKEDQNGFFYWEWTPLYKSKQKEIDMLQLSIAERQNRIEELQTNIEPLPLSTAQDISDSTGAPIAPTTVADTLSGDDKGVISELKGMSLVTFGPVIPSVSEEQPVLETLDYGYDYPDLPAQTIQEAQQNVEIAQTKLDSAQANNGVVGSTVSYTCDWWGIGCGWQDPAVAGAKEELQSAETTYELMLMQQQSSSLLDNTMAPLSEQMGLRQPAVDTGSQDSFTMTDIQNTFGTGGTSVPAPMQETSAEPQYNPSEDLGFGYGDPYVASEDRGFVAVGAEEYSVPFEGGGGNFGGAGQSGSSGGSSGTWDTESSGQGLTVQQETRQQSDTVLIPSEQSRLILDQAAAQQQVEYCYKPWLGGPQCGFSTPEECDANRGWGATFKRCYARQ